MDSGEGEHELQLQRSGMFGREELVWSELAWAPFYLLEIRLSEAEMKALGLPLPFTSITVDGTTEVAWPYYLGLLRRGDKERLVAVDAVRRRMSDHTTKTLTEHHSYVLEALGRR